GSSAEPLRVPVGVGVTDTTVTGPTTQWSPVAKVPDSYALSNVHVTPYCVIDDTGSASSGAVQVQTTSDARRAGRLITHGYHGTRLRLAELGRFDPLLPPNTGRRPSVVWSRRAKDLSTRVCRGCAGGGARVRPPP